MRSLLSFAKTVFSFSMCALLLGAAARAETITWIDPPVARTVGEAEACGVKSLDVALATVTRDSLAVLAAPAQTDTKSPAVALPVAAAPAVGGALEDVMGATTEVSVLPTEELSIDPYPVWSAATVVANDVVAIASNDSDVFGERSGVPQYAEYRKTVAALDRSYWKW
jgi:hypothetical protein